MNVEAEPETASHLVDALADHDVTYLTGGSEDEEGGLGPPANSRIRVPDLLPALARAPQPRLRSALVALLLRHPEYTSMAEMEANKLVEDDPARQLLLISITVAAALRNEWAFSLGIYLPNQPEIHAEHIAADLGLPPPARDFGRACLAGAAELLRRHAEFPYNYESDWRNALRRLLSQLVREANKNGS